MPRSGAQKHFSSQVKQLTMQSLLKGAHGLSMSYSEGKTNPDLSLEEMIDSNECVGHEDIHHQAKFTQYWLTLVTHEGAVMFSMLHYPCCDPGIISGKLFLMSDSCV